MTIDWDKPLECEHGSVELVSKVSGSEYILVRNGDATCVAWYTEWWAHEIDGSPAPSWMPRVYNAKRKPVEGEWWVCAYRENEWVFKYEGDNHWISSHSDLSGLSVEPLYPLIKDPSFSEE